MISKDRNKHLLAIAGGCLVSVIWASSFILIKIGLSYFGPLTLAGLRYFSAFMILLPLVLVPNVSKNHNNLISTRLWLGLFGLGLCSYTIGNGALFWGLKYIPSTTGSLLNSFTPIFVIGLSILWLREKPQNKQLLGVGISLIGSIFFFGYADTENILGICIVIIGVASFALFHVLGRNITKNNGLDTLRLTTFPLGFGGGILLLLAAVFNEWPKITLVSGGIVLWLAVLNTAIAYLIYNWSLQFLTALEMSVILNLMPLFTTFFAWFILGERPGVFRMIGMVVVIIGVILVQLGNRSSKVNVC